MFGIDVYAAYGMTETVTHCDHRQAVGAAADRGRWATSRRATRSRSSTRTPASSCAEGETGELWMRGTRGIQLFLEYFDNPEANEKAFEDGWFKTGDMVKMGAGRQRLLPGARQGPAQGRRRERVGQGGRGRSSSTVPGVRPGRRRRQAARVPRPGRRGVRDHRARRARARRARRRRDHRARAREQLAGVQGAARGLLRRRVPDRHARQAPQEQAPRAGRRPARRSTDVRRR